MRLFQWQEAFFRPGPVYQQQPSEELQEVNGGNLQVNLPFLIDYLNLRVNQFYGGLIKHRMEEWKKLTADEVILSTVSGIGLETNVTSFDNKGMYTNTSFN